jgi:hypothetical protein
VQITTPDAGATLAGEQTITWSGSDTEGDPLTYSVFYSPQGQQTWYPLTIDTAETLYTFNAEDLAGGADVYFRVLASDGFNTSQSTVGPVSLAAPSWGDGNCDGSIDGKDALNEVAVAAGIAAIVDECPDFGTSVLIGGITRVWGDWNCSGAIDAGDAIVNLREFAGLPGQPVANCPALRDPIDL